MKRIVAVTFLALTLVAKTSLAGDLVRGVRFKISAGDLATGIAQVEDYRRTTGVDAEYLDAIGWLARGAALLGRTDLAHRYVDLLRREISEEKSDLIVPFGAAIEVEGWLLAAREGRGVAIRFFEEQLARATAPELRSRICKNMNLLSLEGQPAPPIDTADFVVAQPPSLASLQGKPILLFFWAEWCGDCKAQSASLGRIWQKYRNDGLEMITVTRLYGGTPTKPLTAAEEKAQVRKVWRETYAALDGVPIAISTETMVRYGVSATPTFALIDRKGRVRLYTPTRLSEAELSRKIEEVMSEVPPASTVQLDPG